MCERSKNRTFSVVILFFSEGNKTHLALEMTFDRTVINRSNNVFQKIRIFNHTLVLISALKCVFKWLQKVCWCALKACAPGLVPPLLRHYLLLVLSLFFERNKTFLAQETHHGGLQPLEAYEGSRAESRRCGKFYSFFSKLHVFRHILVKFLL